MFARGSWLAAIALCAGCTTSSDAVTVSVNVIAETTALADEIDEYEIFVLDGFVDCSGRLLSGQDNLAMAVVAPNEAAMLELEAGPQTFHAVGTEFGLPIAVGCQMSLLESGSVRSITVEVDTYNGDPLDAGPPIDAPPQPMIDAAAPVIDAGPMIDAAPIDA